MTPRIFYVDHFAIVKIVQKALYTKVISCSSVMMVAKTMAMSTNAQPSVFRVAVRNGLFEMLDNSFCHI